MDSFPFEESRIRKHMVKCKKKGLALGMGGLPCSLPMREEGW